MHHTEVPFSFLFHLIIALDCISLVLFHCNIRATHFLVNKSVNIKHFNVLQGVFILIEQQGNQASDDCGAN
jgi:hypothetical protein